MNVATHKFERGQNCGRGDMVSSAKTRAIVVITKIFFSHMPEHFVKVYQASIKKEGEQCRNQFDFPQ